MKVEDVMSTDVVTVRPDASLKTVAAQLLEHKISGLPVVSTEGAILGVISEADLLFKERGATSSRTGVLARLHVSSDRGEQLKSQARVAGDGMTSPAITITPHRTLAAAAQLLLEHRIDRLPVVWNGRLVGIVTRADLVRAFARTDEQVAAEVREEVEYFVELIGDYRCEIDVTVNSGEVRLAGHTGRRSTADALPEHLTRVVPGVVDVSSDMCWLEDDSKPERLLHEHRI
jgi:CBS domain-containing protein